MTNSTIKYPGLYLKNAVDQNDVQAVQTVLQSGADLKSYLPEMLNKAALHGYTEIASLLIDSGADAGIQDSAGRTALALTGARKDKVRLLKGASLCGAQTRKPTPEELLEAVERNDIEAVKAFLQRSADVNPDSGMSPLVAAAHRGYVEMASLLLDKGADIHARAPKAYSPLFNAVSGRQIEMVHLLIERGADINIGNAQAGTVMEFAKRTNDTVMVQLLKDAQETQRLRAEAETHGVAAERQRILKAKAQKPLIRGIHP